MSRTRVLILAGVIAGAVMTAVPAQAHVTVSPPEAPAGSYVVLTASVPHGCDGSPTTKVAIQLPEQILSVTPTRNSFWTVEKEMVQLASPAKDAHGNEVTERVGSVVYTALEPLPDGYRDAFELSLRMPETAGETLLFPVIQTCAEGESAWIEKATGGAEPEKPAPTVRVTAGDDAAEHATMPEVHSTSGGFPLGLLTGLLGVAVGVVALVVVRVRRRA